MFCSDLLRTGVTSSCNDPEDPAPDLIDVDIESDVDSPANVLESSVIAVV